MDLSIKNTYYDALFFASADFNKNKSFYLTPAEFKVMIKLIHYGDTYSDITFQNKDIAKHTFLAERTVKNTCESLAKNGFINSERDIYNNRLGYASKRTITINWTFIQTLDDMINQEPDSTPVVQLPVAAPVKKEPIQQDSALEIIHTELIHRYNERGEVKTPADFKNITDDYFKEVPFNEFWNVYKKHKINNVDGFLQLFDELYNLQLTV